MAVVSLPSTSTCEIEPAARRVRFCLRGKADAAALVDLCRSAASDPLWNSTYDLLWTGDGRASFHLDTDEVQALASALAREWGGGARKAVVPDRPEDAAVAEEWAAAMRPREARAFRHIVDAKAYLWRPSDDG